MPSATGYLRAKDSFSGTIKGEPIHVTKGELAHPDHPVVKAYPDQFESAQGHIRLDVEQATKEPGEKRGNRKASKRTPAKPPEAVETRGLRSEDLHRR
jgi:hypothetical protein